MYIYIYIYIYISNDFGADEPADVRPLASDTAADASASTAEIYRSAADTMEITDQPEIDWPSPEAEWASLHSAAQPLEGWDEEDVFGHGGELV